MPSFVADDVGHVNSSTRPSFEPLSELSKSHEKINGNGRPIQRQSTKGSFENGLEEQFDRIHGSNHTGNSIQNDMGLGAAPNGRTSRGSWENKSSRNASAISMNGGMNGAENGRSSQEAPNGAAKSSMDRNSISSNGVSIQPSVEAVIRPVTGERNGSPKTIAIPPPLSTNPQSTGPLTYNSSLLPATPNPDSNRSPHRFSSPPAYALPNSTPATPADSRPSTLQHPGASQLKHRHTLQVPKATPSRVSRDGAEDGWASGRFSPTAARRGSLSLQRRNTRSFHSDMPHDDFIQDEEAMRWAEAIRQKRASKRKRKDEEDDDRVVVGTKVDQTHVNWVTAYNMLTGIRFTVSRTNAKLDRPLTDADFDQRHKFSFDITGNELTPSAKYDFKFKDYAPWVFRSLRAKFRLDPADYLMSLTSKYILSELGSPGKSGSFFYFSRDYKYIIKTIHHAEHKFLRKILRDYYNHVDENPNTLLSQFYGLHRVKIPYGRKIHFVVMNNLFPPHRDIHQTFDLKGSTIGRDFKEEDLEKNPRATLKDLNWLRRHLHLEFGPEKKRIFLEQMEKDVALLQNLKIMDYSMLIGVHDLSKGNQENLRDKTLRVFQPGGEISPDDSGAQHQLMRTPSKLENARKARELRQMIKQEKPVPMGETSTGMPDSMEENATKKDFTFYSDDGGFQATHDDNRPGDEIYYLGIIDCLTHYGMVKRLEHFWKGLSHDKTQISPVPSIPYGDRFIKFITGVTMTREEAEREEAAAQADQSTTSGEAKSPQERRRSNSLNHHFLNSDNLVIRKAETQAAKSENRGSSEDNVPDRTLGTVDVDRVPERGGMTLPIVDEAGESSSTGGRSGASNHEAEDGEVRPPTPPKDSDHRPKRSLSVEEQQRKKSLDEKELPALPRVQSPERMSDS